MGSTSRYGRATINPSAPEALGICDGCGFMFNLRALSPQMAWAGTHLINTGYLKCSTCLDVPNEQLRTIILPPDPPPLRNVRPEPYDVDERSEWELIAPIGAPAMFYGAGAVEAWLTLFSGIRASIDGVSDIASVLTRGKFLAAVVDGVSDVSAELTQVFGTSVALFGSSTANQSSTITAPASIAAGDLIVMLDLALDGSTATIPTSVVPSGFTSIADTVCINDDGRQILSYKLAAGTEGGTSITGMAQGGDIKASKCMYVFRRTAAATSINVASVAAQSTNGNPTAQVVTSSSGSEPLVVIGAYGAFVADIDPRTMSPAKDGEIFATMTTSGTRNTLYLAYKIYNSSPVDVTVDMDDEGEDNTLQSCYIEMGV